MMPFLPLASTRFDQTDSLNPFIQRLQRQLESHVGPCAAFSFTHDDTKECTQEHPKPNPDLSDDVPTGLSAFAHGWIEYTCCRIVKENLAGIIAAVWLWLQVCTSAMNAEHANPAAMSLDLDYAKTIGIKAYSGGPLHNMKQYCPSDLDGGELTEWVVATFFPVSTPLVSRALFDCVRTYVHMYKSLYVCIFDMFVIC